MSQKSFDIIATIYTRRRTNRRTIKGLFLEIATREQGFRYFASITSVKRIISSIMSNKLWNYYQALKPMVILLTASGLFSLHKNPQVLKFLTVANVAFRFSCTLIASIMFLSTLYVNGTRKFASNIHAVSYGFIA